MTEKRYQVFLSSTFTDLEAERDAVWQMLTDMNYIVSGMERFPSSSDEPFTYIKPLIDLSDFFVLIIGARYGSEAEDGLSYTEKEFDYAVSIGVPVLVFPLDPAVAAKRGLVDVDKDKEKKLEKFCEKACQGRLVRSWKDESSLTAAVIQSVLFEEKRKPRPGWVRDKDLDVSEVLLENQELKSRVVTLEALVEQDEEYTVDEMAKRLETAVRTLATWGDKEGQYIRLDIPLWRIMRLESIFDKPSYDSLAQSLNIVGAGMANRSTEHVDGREYTVSHIDVDRLALALRRLNIISFGVNDSKADLVKGRNWLLAHEAARLGTWTGAGVLEENHSPAT